MLKGLLWTTFNESFVEIHISSSKRNVFEKVISKLVVILVRPQWRHMSGSTLVQVMACCLMALSHHLNQCWLIKEILRHSQRANVLFEYSKYQSRIWVWNLYFLNHSQIREQRVDSKHAFFLTNIHLPTSECFRFPWPSLPDNKYAMINVDRTGEGKCRIGV